MPSASGWLSPRSSRCHPQQPAPRKDREGRKNKGNQATRHKQSVKLCPWGGLAERGAQVDVWLDILFTLFLIAKILIHIEFDFCIAVNLNITFLNIPFLSKSSRCCRHRHRHHWRSVSTRRMHRLDGDHAHIRSRSTKRHWTCGRGFLDWIQSNSDLQSCRDWKVAHCCSLKG